MPQPQRAQSNRTAPLLAQAFALHQGGRLAEAERIYAQILVLAPDHFDALHLRGLILHQRGDHAAALVQIEAALRANPDNLLALNNRGLVLNAMGRLDDALASYARALALRPDFPEALLNRGNTLQDLKRYEAAVVSYDRALAARPDYAEAHYNRGNTLHALKRFKEAVASHDRALSLRPDYPEALCNRAIALHALERFDEALASYDRALVLQPHYAAAHGSRGATLTALKRFDAALASYGRAIELQPDDAEAYANRGATLHEMQLFEEALATCDRALALRPDFSEAHCTRGNAFHGLGRFEDALASYDCALASRPDYAEALTNRGVTLHQLKRFDEERSCYARALALEPDFAEAHSNEGWCCLLNGDLERGWDKQEWRWQTRHLGHCKRNFTPPQWTGTRDIAGKTILLHAEQGLGDTIQFCRYAPLVAAYGARVVLEVQPALLGLMTTLADTVVAVAIAESLPAFDMHCPLLSLPRAFGTALTTIPAATPYLHAAPEPVKTWDVRLGLHRRPRIGLAWSGNPTHKNDRNRSIPLTSLLPILDGIDATFVSVQRDVRDADAALLQERRDILHFGHELKDFADTAALISNLDLIVAVDTGVAHLAGALAKPVWVLLPHVPDWRWLLDRDDSPWYPTARLFRQDETRAWDGVVARLKDALRDRFAAR